MTRVVVRRWAAWAPGLVEAQAWEAWARAPAMPQAQGEPDVAFLPRMVRRRCDLVSRMMLTVAHGCLPTPELRAESAAVFASRHGSFAATVSMLEALAAGEALSPTLFMQSVHNAQAGLFSIWSENTRPANAIAARRDTFAYGFLEALCQAHQRDEPVLLVVGDEALPPAVAALETAAASHVPYALGLLLARGGDGTAVDFEFVGDASGRSDPSPLPQALQFLAFLLRGDATLRLGESPRGWRWSRG